MRREKYVKNIATVYTINVLEVTCLTMPGMPKEITLALALFFWERVRTDGGKARTLLDFP